MKEDSSQEPPEKIISALYDELAPKYEKVYLSLSQYYRHLYGEVYNVFSEYFNGVKIRSRVLDLGSGTGIWSALLRRNGYHVVSLDISYLSLFKCKNIRCSDPVQGDAVKLPFRDGYFDAVVAYGSVFNHIIHSEKAFSEVARVLSKGGYLIFDADNLVCADMAYEAILGGISMKSFLRGIVDGKGHIGYWYGHNNEVIPFRFFTYKELIRILREQGFNVVDVKGIHIISNVIPSRLHQWGNNKIRKLAALLYRLDDFMNKLAPMKYIATTFIVVSRKA